MAFPPSFLEELRARVPLAERIMRAVRLTRRGHEYTGLCPFHNEKSPSFTVNEDKGFFHCFGCGAHGDVIGYVMRAENRGFLEAVEALAAEAGIEVPRASPDERRREEERKTLYQVLDAAAEFYAGALAGPAGAAARGYLQGRGLDAAAIARFRLGYAPGGGSALKQHLRRDFPAALIEEAGLARAPEDGRESYDYFRDRVMFPILDRAGRVVGFGGRVMGDAKPKYLNSPDTPLFQKGQLLYGLSWARGAVAKGAEVIVTEGYLDVIALHRAGFEGAVAPLGTALTEAQLEELWRLAPEPILCFDGDAAGARAAERALERALPLVKPGRSLRFARLPEGDDPDSLIAKFGAAGIQPALAAAQPLAEMLWTIELARGPVDTPERRAGLAQRLDARAGRVADADLRREYQRFLRNALFERLRPRRRPKGFGASAGGWRGAGSSSRSIDAALPSLSPAVLDRRQQEVLVRLMLDRPELLDGLIEEFATVSLVDPGLDKLRGAIINVHVSAPGLDAEALKQHLLARGCAPELERVGGRDVTEHVKFAAPGTDLEIVRDGWLQTFALWRRQVERANDLEMAVRRFDEQPSPEAWAHVVAIAQHAQEETLEQSELDRRRE